MGTGFRTASLMKITNIDIADLRYDGTTSRHEGHVSMELRPSREGAPMHVHFLCYSDKVESSPSTLVTHDLIKDALRQAHRMPGFRRGERKIEVDISASDLAKRIQSGL